MNKPVLIVAMLAMILVVSVPALTQTDPTNDIEASPVQEMGAVQYSGDAAVDPSTAPAPAPEPALAPAPEPALAPAPEPAPAPAPEPEPTPEPVFAPAGATVGCGVLYGDPAAICEVDAEGFITLPDGSTAPVLVRPDGTAFVQDASGALTLIGYGASFVTGLEAAGDTAQDTGQGAAPAAEPVAEPEAEPVEPVAEPVIPAA